MKNRDKNAAGANLASQEAQMIALAEINLTDEYRFRVRDDDNTIDHYAEIWQQYLDDIATDRESALSPFEAIVVLLQEDGTYIVIAGRHRFQAAQKVGLKEIPCIVLTDRQEAIRIGLESNRHHGLQLNDGDKKHCIKIAVATLSDKFSNRMIADIIGCSSGLVNKVVKKYQLRTDAQLTEGKDGRMRSAPKKRSKPVQSQGDATTDTGTPVSPITAPSVEPPACTEQGESTQGNPSEEVPETPSIPIDRILNELKIALELPQADKQRAKAIIDVITTIAADCFTDTDDCTADKYRGEFKRLLNRIWSFTVSGEPFYRTM